MSGGTNKIKQAGFTLIEMLVVMAVITVLLSLVSFNFRKNATGAAARHQISSVIVADIRLAQSRAIAGTNYSGNAICGYGLHQTGQNSYVIYAGAPQGAVSNCSLANRNYQNGTDFVVENRIIENTNMSVSGQLAGNFYDIFFESPDPKAFVNNNSSLILAPTYADIYIFNAGQTCGATNCTTIKIYTSGLVEVQN